MSDQDIPLHALCFFCGKSTPIGTACCAKRHGFLSSDDASWAVGYAAGISEGADKLRELRSAVRKYLDSQVHLESFGYQTEEIAELRRLVTLDES